MLVSGGAGPAAAKAAGTPEGGFWSFLDGCLADDAGQGESPEPKHPASGDKNPSDDLAAPTSMPLPAASTAHPPSGWGLEQSENSSRATAAQAQGIAAVDSQDLSNGLDAAPQLAVLPPGTRTAGSLAWDLASREAPAANIDPAKGPRGGTLAAPQASGDGSLPSIPGTSSGRLANELPSVQSAPRANASPAVDFSSGSGSAPQPAVLTPRAGKSGAAAPNPGLPHNDPAAQTGRPYDSTPPGSPAPEFGAGLLPSEPATPSDRSADARPSGLAASPAVSASSTADMSGGSGVTPELAVLPPRVWTPGRPPGDLDLSQDDPADKAEPAKDLSDVIPAAHPEPASGSGMLRSKPLTLSSGASMAPVDTLAASRLASGIGSSGDVGLPQADPAAQADSAKGGRDGRRAASPKLALDSPLSAYASAGVGPSSELRFAPETGLLHGRPGTGDSPAGDLALPPDDPAAQVDSALGPRDVTPPAVSELAFGARLFQPQQAMPDSGVAAVVPNAAAAVPWASASGEADQEDRSLPEQKDHAQPGSAEVPGTARVARSALPGNAQPALQNSATLGNARSSSATEGEGRSQPGPEPRNADALAGVPTKSAAGFSERPQSGDHGENAPAAQADLRSVWSAAAPSPAGREALSAVPKQEASAARSASVEPPEPAAPPVSRDVSLHLADGDSSVDIRMAERAGEIRVTVHTPDHNLANSLRADLPDLVGKLRQNGFQAEAWRPAAAAQSEAGRRSGSDGSLSQEHTPGSRKDGRQQQPQQQQSKKQSGWTGAWKSSLDPAQESHT